MKNPFLTDFNLRFDTKRRLSLPGSGYMSHMNLVQNRSQFKMR